MADKYDPYREALIVEENTVWSEDFDELEPEIRRRVEVALHADPEAVAHLEYVRMHTGFCRQVTATAEEVQQHGGADSGAA
ncbi:MAG: hypothetical protein CMJ81_14365 [Planctomycetaceae bacterium]|jgi:hypothetical protein|nr:hypothetical protein [Planctomycetaceae bacterium]MBP63474.1 hypothetical protein [Planctomycetaceae bacterium]